MRANIKDKQTIYPASQTVKFTPKIIENLAIKHIGFSDSKLTMNTEYSWILKDVNFGGSIVTSSEGVYPPTYISGDIVNHYAMIANYFNGLTPTATTWDINYDRGYLFFSGTFLTYGNWTKMYVGANWTSMVNIGENTSFRTGGWCQHTGEYIHTSCNGYDKKEHSITSRSNWDNIRVFWVSVSESVLK